jgi:transcriptional regulator with XRE-family HTH domain
MDSKKKELSNSKSIDYIQRLKNNDVKTPNEFTKLVGKFIREAREQRHMSQVELAEKINRRPATISEIENGKSDISIQALLSLAIALEKPISYFFPKSLLKDIVMDVKSPFQQKGLEILTGIEFFGDQKLTLDILKVLSDSFEEDYEHASHPENYIEEHEEE